MRKFIVAALLVASMVFAGSYLDAQEQAAANKDTPTVVIEFTEQERVVLLEMCEAAKWANRIRFDGLCEYLRGKLDAAEKAAKVKP